MNGFNIAYNLTVATILLAEDNELVSEMTSERLKMHGFNVVAVGNGLEVLAYVRQQFPDLILLDMSMPVLDGWRTAQKLKDDPATRKIPIIAVTAHALIGDRQKALQSGCDVYVTKPVNFPDLLAKINGLLEIDSQYQ